MPRKVDFFPALTGQDWWQSTNYPKQILNQKFATVLCNDDLSNSDIHQYKGFKIRPLMPASMKSSGASEVIINDYGFQVSLDLDDYKLEELSVSISGRFVEIHGKQAEKRDQYGLVSKEFFRHYMVPYDCDINAVTSSFSTDCKLKIKVPKKRKGDQSLERSPKCVMKLEADKYIEIIQRDLARGAYDQFLVAEEETEACSE